MYEDKDKKYDILLNAAIVLLIVSAILLGFSIYKVYFKEPNTSDKKNVIASSGKLVSSTRDSLQSVYSNTIKEIDTGLLNNNNRDTALQAKYEEMDVLKTEIASLLKGQTENDLASAKLKIEELQLKVALLQNRYTGVEAENKRLLSLINQLMAANKANNGNLSNATIVEIAKSVLKENNSTSTNTSNSNSSTIALDARLYAVAENNNKEIETSSADDADKINGSFVFKNNSGKGNGEVIVIVMQPDGKVVKNSVWETGTFETKDGKKIYSKKIFTEPQGEEKRLNFSLSPDGFMKGNYTMQVWYNGNMIARAVKVMG